MALKTLVKVGNITNLSDARYCSGMGVEMLGFVVVDGSPNFVNAKTYQEIRGWVSGPSFVAEIYGLQGGMVSSVLENYAPDFLELSITDLDQLSQEISIPLILSVDDVNNKIIELWKNKISFLLINSEKTPLDSIKKMSENYAILLSVGDKTDTLELLEHLPIKGFNLQGNEETKPGLKNYDHLSFILEQLETVD